MVILDVDDVKILFLSRIFTIWLLCHRRPPDAFKLLLAALVGPVFFLLGAEMLAILRVQTQLVLKLFFLLYLPVLRPVFELGRDRSQVPGGRAEVVPIRLVEEALRNLDVVEQSVLEHVILRARWAQLERDLMLQVVGRVQHAHYTALLERSEVLLHGLLVTELPVFLLDVELFVQGHSLHLVLLLEGHLLPLVGLLVLPLVSRMKGFLPLGVGHGLLDLLARILCHGSEGPFNRDIQPLGLCSPAFDLRRQITDWNEQVYLLRDLFNRSFKRVFGAGLDPLMRRSPLFTVYVLLLLHGHPLDDAA